MGKIIAAVKSVETLKKMIDTTADTVFYITPNIDCLNTVAELSHKSGKTVYIHMDMTEGLGKDRYGVGYVKQCGIDGIISTRSNIIKFAREAGLKTVQRFFIIDALSVHSTADTVKSAKPDMIEVMPGCAPKIIEKLKPLVNVPIIAGGLIETDDEVEAAFSAGAYAISTSRETLWVK